MNATNAALIVWSYGFAGLAYAVFFVVLAARGFLKSTLHRPQLALMVALLGCAVWGSAMAASVMADSTLLLRAAVLADTLRYGAWLGFLLALMQVQASRRRGTEMTILGLVAVLALLSAVLLQFLRSSDPAVLETLRKARLFSALALPITGMVLLEQVYRNASDDSRWNIKPLCLGLAGVFLFDTYLFSEAVLFNRIDGDAHAIRGAIHALVLPFLIVSTLRNKDWVSRIQISRTAAFHSATLMIAGVYMLFISSVGYYVRYFGGEWGRALQLGLVFLGLLALAVLAVSGSARASLRVYLGKHFFRYRYDYREEWLRFTQTLSDKSSPQSMGEQVIRGLADMLDSPGGGLWLKSRVEPGYRQTARWNLAVSEQSEDAGSALIHFLQTSGWVVNLEEFRSYPRRYGQLVLPQWLQELPQVWLVVPLTVGDDLIGFVVLAKARARIDVNWEVNDLLKTAGRQAASFLALMQATEALLEVRKFDAFNRMSAFVVHDLKNIVTQLSLMMKNARRLQDNPEFRQDMLLTVENSLDRMRQLMLQLREGATPPGTPVGVDLQLIARRVAKVAADRGRRLELDVADAVVTRGHEERIERIVGHMVQNAFDATGADGRVWLRLDRLHGQAVIEVGDTGHGMTEEFVQERLFKPFQTTKQAGMGIGAYESFQYVQELGGKISVDSALNRGTVVTVLLPLFEIQRHSDLQPLDTP